ncbi:MAG: ATP-binding protein [Eubacteriales bacterium]|nr:ATP-binding protein [Eubacteriales bacterium]MDD3880673.1 ATP-binding protein [Eubacteriales bacterium]MDD4511693.1 ATP-binding protein [Eubacteriales bacterium]
MKTVLGAIRRADEDFNMIQRGDRIAVGVSGGKDSLLLLYALSLYRNFPGRDFSLVALTLDMGRKPFDTAPVQELCDKLGVEYHVKESEIAHIIFDIRKEKNPCALCAKMRRGVLSDMAKEYGCNKLAFAHSREDALETLMMSLIFEARLYTFNPVTYWSRSDLTVIRPMIYLPEKHIIHVVKEYELPVVKNPCPANGNTKRQEMKELMKEMTSRYPQFKDYMLRALQDDEGYGLWFKPKKQGAETADGETP